MTHELPEAPANLFPGAVDHGNGRVTFVLYAPDKQSVHLVGDFNGWDRSADPLHGTESGLWWLEKNLEPGSYTYQFWVDQNILICDPYAHQLAEGAEADPPRAVVEVGRQPFQWQHDQWARPSFNDLIIYELHIDDFSPEGNFQGVINRLDYLEELGINAIELMPINEFGGEAHGWGYNPAYFFTTEKSYGPPDMLRQIIDQAHAHGIAVILDVVLAHTAHRHPFNQLYDYSQSPWYGRGLGRENEFGFPTLDYGKGPAQAFARDVMAYWLHEFHVDGFRYDYLAGIGIQGDMGVPFLVRTAKELRPDVYLIGEYSPEEPPAVNESGLDGAWHITVSYVLKAFLTQGEFNVYRWDDFEHAIKVFHPWDHGYARASQMINLVESHDEERLAYHLREAGVDEEMIWRKLALATSVLITLPGQPMLYHGQEWGEATQRTTQANPIHWEQLETQEGKALFNHYQKLCRLRHEHPALRTENVLIDRVQAEQKSIIYHRWDDAGDEVVVAVNFSPETQNLELPFSSEGRWHEIVQEKTVEVDGEFTATLEPWTALIFVSGE